MKLLATLSLLSVYLSISTKTTLNWPICSTCAAFRYKASRMETFIFFWAILVTLAGIWAFMGLPIFKEGHPITGFLLFFVAPVSVAISATLYARKRRSELATSMGLPFAHEPIQFRNVGKQTFGSGNMLEVYCYHADYALAYKQVNLGNGKITIKPDPAKVAKTRSGKASKPANSDPLQPWLSAIKALVNTNTSEEAAEIIRQHPELLSEEADKVFEYLIAQQTSKEDRSILQAYREGLQQARQVKDNEGVSSPIQDDHLQHLLTAIRTLLASNTGEEVTETIQKHPALIPELLSVEADQVFEALIAQQTSDEARAALQLYRQALRQVRNPEHLMNVIKTLLASSTNEEAVEVIQKHPELLSRQADTILKILIEQSNQAQTRAILQSHRQNLQQVLCYHQALQHIRQTSKNGGIPPHFQTALDQAESAETRYRQTGDLAALDESIAAWERILQHPDFATVDAKFRAKVLNNSPSTYSLRYQARGDLSDLDRALSAWQTLVTTTPPESPHLPGLLNNQGNGLLDRYKHTGNPADLQVSIDACQRAVQLTPENAPNFPTYLSSLSTGLSTRATRTGNLADLQAGIAALQQAIKLTPEDSPDLAMYLNNLGIALTNRATRTGDLSDLQTGIKVLQQAVQLTSQNSPNLPSILNSLGNALRVRANRTENLSDLQAGIETYLLAVQLTPKSSPNLHGFLNNLNNSLSDLQAGIKILQLAVQQTPKDSPNLPGFLNTLNSLSDLQARIEAQQVVQLTPKSSPNLPSFLNSSLEDHATRTGDLSDLQARIKAKTVMVVDDAPKIRGAVKILLEKRGMNVLTAEDGVDAVAQLQEHIPDLILLDEEMPNMDGYELAERIHNTSEWKHIPIIMMVPNAVGIDRYLEKPFTSSELSENVNALLKEKGNTQLSDSQAAKTIMVVDDSATIRRIAELLLKKQGMNVLTAKDGIDAVTQLQKHIPDLILLDKRMPRMDGCELATRIRNTTEWKHIPIIMMMGAVGANRYFGKPFLASELFENVNAIFTEREQINQEKQ